MKADSLRQTKPQYLKSKIADYAQPGALLPYRVCFAVRALFDCLGVAKASGNAARFLVDLDRHGERAQRGDGI